MTGLYLSDPFPSLQCNRGKCPIQGECNNHCMKENVMYRATCNKCTVTQLEQGLAPENIIERQYTGETARTIRIRAQQTKTTTTNV